MADNGGVFNFVLRGKDEFAATLSKASGAIRAVGRAIGPVRDHLHGMAIVGKAAFGEVGHGAHAALGEVARGSEAAMHGLRESAEAAQRATAGLHDVAHAAGALHGTAKAVHEVGNELRTTTHDAALADHALAHAARLRQWETLGGHFSLLRSRFGDLRLGVGEFGNSMSSLLPVLGGLGVAGSLEGLFELTEQSAEAFSQMSNAAQSMGVNVKQFQELSLAAKMADVSVDTLKTGMFRLGYGMQDAISGRNKDLAGLFKQIHIDPHADIMKVMSQLADAFEHTGSKKMRQRMAEALFGRGGADMIPFLAGGSDKLKEFFNLADKVSFTPSKEQGEALEHYHQSMVGLTAAVDGFRLAVGASLADAMRPILDMMRDWIADNRDWLAQEIGEKLKEFGAALKRVDWKAVGAAIHAFGDDAAWLADHLGGAKGMLEALVAVKGASWAAEWIDKLLKISLAVRAITASVQAMDVAISNSAVGAAIAKILPAGTRVAGAVGAGLYTYFNPTQITPEGTERAALDKALRNMNLPPAVRQNVRQLSNILAPPGTLPPPAGSGSHPGFPAPLHYGTPLAMPRLYAPGGALAPAPAAAPAQGRVSVDLHVRGLPETTDVRTRTSGIADLDEVDVGRAMSGLFGTGGD